MGILAQHVPSIEQLKPGLVEIIEESGGSKQFFRTLWLDFKGTSGDMTDMGTQSLEDLLSYSRIQY